MSGRRCPGLAPVEQRTWHLEEIGASAIPCLVPSCVCEYTFVLAAGYCENHQTPFESMQARTKGI